MTMLSNPEIEDGLISAVLNAPKSWHRLAFVAVEDFTQPDCQVIWGKIKEFSQNGQQITPALLAAAISSDEPVRKSFHARLLALMPTSTFDGSDYAFAVHDVANRRRIVAQCDLTKIAALDTVGYATASEVAHSGSQALIASHADLSDFTLAHDLGEQVIADMGNPPPVFQTGFPKLDNALGGGFFTGRYYGIGARMKHGKSLFMSTLAHQMAKNGTRILYLCLEMSAKETMQRVLAMEMGINALQFMDAKLCASEHFKARVKAANEDLKGCKLYYRAKPRMTLDDLRATLARAALSGLVDGVIVDYLQLVEGKSNKQSSAEHYDNVAQSLAEAVKKYPIWILSAAQLNQDGNIRGSEGLLNACDMTFAMHKIDGDFKNRIPDRAWLEMRVSRYTPYDNIGSAEVPGYEIDAQCGPKFVEL